MDKSRENDFDYDDLPILEKVANGVLSLPLYPFPTEEGLKKIAEAAE